jgi:transcriptional regulator with XRE-family HTH domain
VQNFNQDGIPLPSPSTDLGGRLRALRMRQQLSQRELGRRARLAHAAISQIEQNKVSPSVASLRKIVHALGLTLGEFFTTDAPAPRQVFFPASDLPEIGAEGVSLRLVGAKVPGRTLQILRETYPPGADTGTEMLEHAGEEGGVVVAGSITITVGAETRLLKPGDAYLFPSTLPHRFRNDSDEVCEIVSASTPPTF